MGTHERFIGFLIEHYAGNFPLWLAPDQVRVITLNDDAALIDYAQPIVNELRANMVRVDSDFSATPFKAKIANAEQLRVHTMLVIGGRDLEAGAVSVRLHHGGPQASGLLRQSNEDGLSDFFGLMRGARMARCYRIDLVDVPCAERGKRVFGVLIRVSLQQGIVI